MKRIAYIDHSFHAQTHSSQFMLSLLQEHFEVDTKWDYSWNGGEKVDLVELNKKDYDAIVFFQTIQRYDIGLIRCPNICYVPMYDEVVSLNRSFWKGIFPVKIISFSRQLDKILSSLNFDYFPVQYYPKPITPFVLSDPDQGVFFWQRINQIDWRTVKSLIRKQFLKRVHLHRAVDPGCRFNTPSKSEIADYNITFSDWFQDQEEYIAKVKDYAFFVSPRVREGIGMSFLQAMSMGKIVIAADGSTMNEYIRDGVNGYLFNPFKPHRIRLGKVASVMQNAYETIDKGWRKWSADKYSLIEFLDRAYTQKGRSRFQEGEWLSSYKLSETVSHGFENNKEWNLTTK